MAIDDCLKAECKGMKIEVVSADHQNKADIAATKAREWLDRDKVDALADLTNSAGALAVLSTLEDRWGRPGYDSGPLYILEALADGRTALALYWPRVPEARRGETGGADHVYWRGADPALKACLECHGRGIAPARDRSQWKVPRRPKPEEAAAAAPEGS